MHEGKKPLGMTPYIKTTKGMHEGKKPLGMSRCRCDDFVKVAYRD
jgi:hypothetical protein